MLSIHFNHPCVELCSETPIILSVQNFDFSISRLFTCDCCSAVFLGITIHDHSLICQMNYIISLIHPISNYPNILQWFLKNNLDFNHFSENCFIAKYIYRASFSIQDITQYFKKNNPVVKQILSILRNAVRHLF